MSDDTPTAVQSSVEQQALQALQHVSIEEKKKIFEYIEALRLVAEGRKHDEARPK